MPKRNPRRTDKEWLDLIQECRSSGLSDKCWCQEHHIHTSNFYYQIRRLRQKACEIPEPVHSSFSGKQEVVPLSFEEPAVCPSSVQLKTDTIPDSVIKITYHSFQIEITNAAGFMLGDLSGVSKIFVITGRTDMRKSFDGLMAIIRDTYELDPYANAVYLFCGRDSRKLKALHFDKDGFVLLQKRLDGNGRFQWPRNASEARLLTRQEFRWLMEGLSIDQPKAIKGTGRKKDF